MNDFLELGYLGLALCAFLAGTPVPMNSEVALSLALANDWPVWPCLISCIIGNWLGSATNFFLGKLCSYEQLLKWTKVNPTRLQKVKTFLNGKGTWLALGSSLVIVGELIIISYGIMRTPFWKIAPLMLIGQILRYGIWTALTSWIV